MARKPETTWEMLNNALHYYQDFLSAKSDKYTLTVVDLLFISNFKGGNASITEPMGTLSQKLKTYEKKLRAIADSYEDKALKNLNESEVKKLIEVSGTFLGLTSNKVTKIRGFGPSYASALLCAFFTELVPVLDRRILNGAGIKVKYDSQKQVKNIESHYEELIWKSHEKLKNTPAFNLRELDKKWFIKDL